MKDEIKYDEIVKQNESAQNSNQKTTITQNSQKSGKNEQKSDNFNKKSENYSKNGEGRHRKNPLRPAVIGLSITAGILGLTTLGFGIGWGINMGMAQNYSTQIENIYKKNYFELVDNVNSADMKISKLLASNNADMQAKMLTEISQEANDMQSNVANLPLTGENVLESVRFINQMSGYCQTLEKKLVQGGELTDADLKTLRDMHETLTEMKLYLNRMSEKMLNGYSILQASSHMNGDLDDFTLEFEGIKSTEADYPSLIYDGPFSDSVVNAKIKGLSGSEVSRDEAYAKVDKLFKNISNLKFDGESDGRFSTYNFVMENSDMQNLYVQVTKIGGHVLTVSGNVQNGQKQIDMNRAEKIALDFAKANGVQGGKVVWSEELKDQAYFNITPMQDGIVLYPDLVKVKVDMQHGDVIGYDAMTYFTNHTARNLTAGGIGIDLAREKVDSSFAINGQRLVLAPLEYNREVLCYEFEATRDDATYYIYFNAKTGAQENILKVVETEDGSKLM